MIRDAALLAVAVAVGVAIAVRPAQAQPQVQAQATTQSPEPCVNRGAGLVRPIRDIELYPGSLQYCTGVDCWSFNLTTRTVAPLPGYLPAAPRAGDPPGEFSDGHGTTLAVADETHVEFCPRGTQVAASCRTFKLKLPVPAAAVKPELNDLRTLGTVTYRGQGDGDKDPPIWLLAFNLATRKQVAQRQGTWITPLDHGFLVDRETLYSAAFKQVARIAAPDEVWVKLGSTDRIALRDTVKGDVIVQNTMTGKAVRFSLGARDPTTWYALAASPDGATLYAIGSEQAEGEVLVIDVAKTRVIARATAPVCAAGTHRLH